MKEKPIKSLYGTMHVLSLEDPQLSPFLKFHFHYHCLCLVPYNINVALFSSHIIPSLCYKLPAVSYRVRQNVINDLADQYIYSNIPLWILYVSLIPSFCWMYSYLHKYYLFTDDEYHIPYQYDIILYRIRGKVGEFITLYKYNLF